MELFRQDGGGGSLGDWNRGERERPCVALCHLHAVKVGGACARANSLPTHPTTDLPFIAHAVNVSRPICFDVRHRHHPPTHPPPRRSRGARGSSAAGRQWLTTPLPRAFTLPAPHPPVNHAAVGPMPRLFASVTSIIPLLIFLSPDV